VLLKIVKSTRLLAINILMDFADYVTVQFGVHDGLSSQED